VNADVPRWPFWVLGLVAAISGGTCMALGIDLGWAVITTTVVGMPIVGWLELRRPRSSGSAPLPPRPSTDFDEDFVRRLEVLASRMRRELEERRRTRAG
jgi:hypothetical protein